MDCFFKSKNIAEATSQIFERLSLVPDELKSATLSAILNYSKTKNSLKKYPMMVKCHSTKPSFALSDGDLLYCFAIKKSGALTLSTEIRYGGSADTVLWHQGAQLSEGQLAPQGQVGIFVVECASGGGGNRSWMVDVWVGLPTAIERHLQYDKLP